MNGLLLEGLTPATTYKMNIVVISPITKVLCNTTFTTQGR